jgi:hemerythrin-like domain-containing protein
MSMTNPIHPPLKRHASLQPLSRDHYVGLVQAQHLIKSADGSPADRAKALADFVQAWAEEISAHFNDEERLLPELVAGAPRERLHREHCALADLAEEARRRTAAPDPGAAWIRELGQLLNDHIRWEERELFPLIEHSASAEQLRELTQETDRIERSRARNVRRPSSSNARAAPRD